MRGSGDLTLLSKPAVAVVGARACSSYGRSVARSLGRELAAAGSGRDERDGARRGRRGASRSARGGRDHGGRPRLRHRPRLSGRTCRARAPDLRARPRRVRVRAGRRAGSLAVSRPQPDHRRPLPCDGRRRGEGAERRAHHRRLRARGGARRARRAGRDHERALGRDERAPEARRDAGHVRRTTSSSSSTSQPAKAEPADVGETAQTILDRLREGALTADEVVRTSGLDPAAAAAALVELELARRIELEDGVYRARSSSLRDRRCSFAIG